MVQDPPFVFVEKQPVQVPDDRPQQFTDVVIRRDPALTNDLLPVEHSQRVGARILTRLQELFNGTASALPRFDYNNATDGSSTRPNAVQVQAALQQLVALFVLNGYAFDGTATLVNDETTWAKSSSSRLQFCLSLTSPATLWGAQALLNERAVVTNNFL